MNADTQPDNPAHVFDDTDWLQAFDYADFAPDDVDKILYLRQGGGSDPWVLVARLADGRLGYLAVWCKHGDWHDDGVYGESGISPDAKDMALRICNGALDTDTQSAITGILNP